MKMIDHRLLPLSFETHYNCIQYIKISANFAVPSSASWQFHYCWRGITRGISFGVIIFLLVGKFISMSTILASMALIINWNEWCWTTDFSVSCKIIRLVCPEIAQPSLIVRRQHPVIGRGCSLFYVRTNTTEVSTGWSSVDCSRMARRSEIIAKFASFATLSDHGRNAIDAFHGWRHMPLERTSVNYFQTDAQGSPDSLSV